MARQVVTLTLNPSIDESCVVDRVEPEHKLRGRQVRRDPGGGGINVARVLGRLDTGVRAYWTKSGAAGEQLAALLDAHEVDHRPVRACGETRRNLHVCEAEGSAQYRFTMPGPELSEQDAERWLAAAEEMDRGLVVLSGSLAPGLPDEFYRQLVSRLGEGRRVVLDTSGEPLRAAVASGVFLVKPNRRELSQMAGRDLEGPRDVEEEAQRLVREGQADNVVVSMGAGGALAVSEAGLEHVSSPSVHARSKIGAGDSMLASIVARLAAGDSLIEATRWGVAAGAAAVLTEGTELCRAEDVRRLREQMG